MQDYKKIDVWKRSYEFSKEIYGITSSFPDEEKFGLASQVRRAAVSIPINIAEGSGRNSRKDFANFIQIAIGSASEVECELLLSKDLNFIDDENFSGLCKEIIEIRKMLISFRKPCSITNNKNPNNS